jgi:hypothetical protein
LHIPTVLTVGDPTGPVRDVLAERDGEEKARERDIFPVGVIPFPALPVAGDDTVGEAWQLLLPPLRVFRPETR